MKSNKEAYLQIVDLVHQFECVIIGTCVAYQYNLPLETLRMMGEFAE
jgi:hypothetical protein